MRAEEMHDIENTCMKKWASWPLMVALCSVVLVILHLSCIMICGMTLNIVLGFGLLLLALLGAVLYLFGAAIAAMDRHRRCPWRHLAALSIVVGVSLLLWFGRVPNRVLALRTQQIVARTGGLAALQAWAAEMTAKPRDLMKDRGRRWEVPKEYYSEQVRRLHPYGVFIAPVFQGGQEGVCLVYPIPHGAGMEIRVGPPGAEPVEHEERPDDGDWFRCTDGLYNWLFG